MKIFSNKVAPVRHKTWWRNLFVVSLMLWSGLTAYVQAQEAPTAFSIKEGSQSAKLAKESETWFLNDRIPANSATVTNFLDTLLNSDNPKLISQSGEELERYGFNESNSLEIRSQEKNNSQIKIGKTNSEVYLKNHDSKNVYLIQNLNPEQIDTSVNNWANMAITDFSQDTIQEVDLIKNKTEQKLIKTDSKWQFEGKEIDSAKIDRFLLNLSHLTAISILDSFDNSGNLPVKTIKTVPDGQEIISLNFYVNNSDYLVKKNDQEIFYLISPESFDNLSIE